VLITAPLHSLLAACRSLNLDKSAFDTSSPQARNSYVNGHICNHNFGASFLNMDRRVSNTRSKQGTVVEQKQLFLQTRKHILSRGIPPSERLRSIAKNGGIELSVMKGVLDKGTASSTQMETQNVADISCSQPRPKTTLPQSLQPPNDRTRR
jgi:hypothetical protein